jgi:hypothetical protein
VYHQRAIPRHAEENFPIPCEVCGGADPVQTSAKPVEEGGHVLVTKHASGKMCEWPRRQQDDRTTVKPKRS